MHWEQCRGYKELKTEKNQSINRNYRGWLCSVLVKLWWNRDKDSDLHRIPYLQIVLGRVLCRYAAQIPPIRIETAGYRLKTAGYRMDGNKEEGSSSEDRQPIPTAHEIGESSGKAEKALQGEKDCTFYSRTGSCKYGATCKYNHPPPLMPVPGCFVYPGPPVHVPQLYQAGAPFLPSSRPPFHRSSRFESPLNPSLILTSPAQVSTAPWHPYQVSFLQQGFTGSYLHPALTSQEHLGVGLTSPLTPGSGSIILTSSAPSTPGHLEEGYPQRPGQQECSYYMKTGVCKFGWQCKFHHPKDRHTSLSSSHASSVLPLRPGAAPCTFFNRFGYCKYGPACKFDHSLMQAAYPGVPSSTAITQITTDGVAAPSVPILSAYAEDSSGSPSKSKEDAATLSTSIQRLNIQSKHHG
ncbi:hypothetical protein L7F22_048959 [Adiantum nelumboides]|nr:hypothetical protein [Adiantum nelumboides]